MISIVPGPNRMVAARRCGGHPRLSFRGFTLIELLLVIAVITILAAMIIPTLSQSKTRALRISCINNLKQLAAADIMYLGDQHEFPPNVDFVPGSIGTNELQIMAGELNCPLPPGPLSSWPHRALQPQWYNCPIAAKSGYAEGLTLGGGIYTGYAYLGGVEESTMVSQGLETIVNPGRAADLKNTRRGVLWADLLDEFISTDPRRFEFFHQLPCPKYSDFVLQSNQLDGISRAWSDGSVIWVAGKDLNLSGPGSPDLRIQDFLGNYYF